MPGNACVSPLCRRVRSTRGLQKGTPSISGEVPESLRGTGTRCLKALCINTVRSVCCQWYSSGKGHYSSGGIMFQYVYVNKLVSDAGPLAWQQSGNLPLTLPLLAIPDIPTQVSAPPPHSTTWSQRCDGVFFMPTTPTRWWKFPFVAIAVCKFALN